MDKANSIDQYQLQLMLIFKELRALESLYYLYLSCFNLANFNKIICIV